MPPAPGRDFVALLKEVARTGGNDSSLEALAVVLRDAGLTRCSASSLARCGRGEGPAPSGPDEVLAGALRGLAGADHRDLGPDVDRAVRLRGLVAAAMAEAGAPRRPPGSEPRPSDYVALDDTRRPVAARFVDDLLAAAIRCAGGTNSARTLGRLASIGSDRARDVYHGTVLLPPDRFERMLDRIGPGTDGPASRLARIYLDEFATALDRGRWGAALDRLAARTARPQNALPRVIGRDREALTAQVLPEMPRLATLVNALRGRTGDQPRITVLTGDGGLGKSVMIGQVIATVQAGEAAQAGETAQAGEAAPSGAPVLPWRSALLVACASMSLGGHPAETDVAVAMAEAAGIDGGSGGVLATLDRLATTHGRPVLLLDALDVVLADQTFGALAAFLARVVESHDVIVTCREHEFTGYFGDLRRSAPTLLASLAEARVPLLTDAEIVTWARAHLERVGELGPDQQSFLASLQDGVERARPLRQVCAVPLRLALTCQIFADLGRVPEDLTVTGLYAEYWRTRVRSHDGRSAGPAAIGKEDAALAAAAQVVNAASRFVMRIPRGAIAARHRAGLARLTSEGVLREFDTGWEFFHQTFAEFAHGRYLLSLPSDSAALDVLVRGVGEGRRGLWAIVSSLLLQTDDDVRFREVSDALPADDPEGARIGVLAGLARTDGDGLQSALARAARAREATAAVLPLVPDAPHRHLDTVFDWTLDRVRNGWPAGISPATAAVAALLTRFPAAEVAARLSRVLAAVHAARGRLREDAWAFLSPEVLRRVFDSVAGGRADVWAEVWGNYPALGVVGRQTVLRRVLADPESDLTATARVALRHKRPPLDGPEALEILRLCWETEGARKEMGWSDWRDLVAVDLPKGWVTAQILLLADWAAADPGFTSVLLAELMSGALGFAPADVRRVFARLVNVLQLLVPLCGDRITDELLAADPPGNAPAFGAVADCAPDFARVLDPDRRRALDAWLAAAPGAAPSRSWPARVTLAGDDPALHRAIAAELIAEDTAVPDDVVGRALDAWLYTTPSTTLRELVPVVRPVFARGGLSRQARLEATTVAGDAESRAWVRALLLDQATPEPASSAALVLRDALTGSPLDRHLAGWVAGLLESPHADVVRKLGEALLEDGFVEAGILADVLPDESVLRRTEYAVTHDQDGVSLEKLLELMIRTDRVRPASPADVEAMFRLHRRRLPAALADIGPQASADQSSAVRHLARIAGTLGARRLAPERNRELLGELLGQLDLAVFGSTSKKMRKSVSAMLIGFLHRDPAAGPWMEDLFRDDRVSEGVQWAVAQAALVVDQQTGSRLAERLRNDPRCQPAVLAHLLTSLDKASSQ